MSDERILKFINEVAIGTEWKHKILGYLYVVDSFCVIEPNDVCNGAYLKLSCNGKGGVAVHEMQFFDVFERVESENEL